MFKTHSKLKEELAAAETVNAQLESDFTAAQAELTDALKAKEELFAQVEASNQRAIKAEADLKAAQELLAEAETKVESATKAEAKVVETANAMATATVASIGTEPVPSAVANDEPDIVTQWKAKAPGNERAAFFKANAAAIKAALGM